MSIYAPLFCVLPGICCTNTSTNMVLWIKRLSELDWVVFRRLHNDTTTGTVVKLRLYPPLIQTWGRLDYLLLGYHYTVYPWSIQPVFSLLYHILQSCISRYSIISATSQVMCRSRHLLKEWLQLYSMALNKWTREMIWKFQLRCNLEISCKYRSWNSCRHKYRSSYPTGTFKIYTPGLPSL